MQNSIMDNSARDEIIALTLRENKYSKGVISGAPVDCSSSSSMNRRLSPVSVTGLFDCEEASTRVCEWMYQVSKPTDSSLG